LRKLRTSVSQAGFSQELLVALLCQSPASMGWAWAGGGACWDSAGALEPPPLKRPPMAWPIDEPTATPLREDSVSLVSFFRGRTALAEDVGSGTYAAVDAIWPNSPGPALCCTGAACGGG
jgi:hypothetical protein